MHGGGWPSSNAWFSPVKMGSSFGHGTVAVPALTTWRSLQHGPVDDVAQPRVKRTTQPSHWPHGDRIDAVPVIDSIGQVKRHHLANEERVDTPTQGDDLVQLALHLNR